MFYIFLIIDIAMGVGLIYLLKYFFSGNENSRTTTDPESRT